MKNITLLAISALLFSACSLKYEHNKLGDKKTTAEVERIDNPSSSILKGVYIPTDKELFYTSGLVASVKDTTAAVGDPARYGNLEEQAISTLERIKTTLAEKDFDLEDVIFLTVYLAPDSEGNIDWQTWFDVYGRYFNNEENPNKVARSTIGVYKLANPDLLIEIEAVAAK